MRHPSFMVLLGAAEMVVATNDFLPTPPSFSFKYTTPFSWENIEGTSLKGLSVRGNTDPTESINLPLLAVNCIDPEKEDCVTWANNGTAHMGGQYATGLRPANFYHFYMEWRTADGSTIEASNSSVFSMVDPILSTASTSSSEVNFPSTSSTFPGFSKFTSERSPHTATSLTPAESPSAISAAKSQTTSSARPKQLSTGVKVGIAIGTLAAALFFILATYFLFQRSRKVKNLPRFPRETEATQASTRKEDQLSYTKEHSNLYVGELQTESTRHQSDAAPQPHQAITSTPRSNDNEGEQPVCDTSRENDTHLFPSPTPPRATLADITSRERHSFAVDPEDAVLDESQMTPAQLQELEEEERRIDEAIKESERLMKLRRQTE